MVKMLEIKDLVTKIEEKKIINNIHLNLSKGEFLGIVGPNGAGKTTLLRSITNVLKPIDGKIKINNKNIENMNRKEISKIMSMVPQNSFISFPFKAKDVVLMGRSPYKGRFDSINEEDRKEAKKYMNLTNTWQFRDKKVNELSGGEIQRISIARALVQNPQILLMDEPTSHLDLNHEFNVLSLIKELQEDGLSIISVFHDLNLASRFCDRIIILKKGKIFSKGKPKKILTTENVSKVYGANVIVKKNPTTNNPYIIPVSHSHKNKKKRKHSIHVVCGGGSGSRLIKLLTEEGYDPSVGVINVLDSDYETSNSLDLDIISEAPFSPISKEAFQENNKMIKNSEIIILTNLTFGKGNIRNLKSIKESLKNQKLIIIEKKPVRERDHTNGEAQKIYKELKDKAEIHSNSEEVIKTLNKK